MTTDQAGSVECGASNLLISYYYILYSSITLGLKLHFIRQ